MSELDRVQTKGKKGDSPITIPTKLPLLPVRDIVVFPAMVLPLAVGRDKSIKALEEAMSTHRLVFLVAQKHVQNRRSEP